MIKTIKTFEFYNLIKKFDREHPYLFSFFIAAFFLIIVLFWSPQVGVVQNNISPYEQLQFVNIEQTEAPRRLVKKQLSLEEGETTDIPTVDRATGISDSPDAVDLSFYPNIAPPKPIGRFLKIYPRSARDMNIEAQINVELLISASGTVLSVNILAVRLSKTLPPDLQRVISSDFARDARKILMEARFTPPVVDGKNVPVRMDMPMRFRLE